MQPLIRSYLEEYSSGIDIGLTPPHIRLLSLERHKHPIQGSVLTLGQQAVYATLADVHKIITSHGGSPRALKQDFDIKNKIPSWNGTSYNNYTNAHAVLSLLGAEKVLVADYSDYENPDYIMDLNNRVSDEYAEQFDVVLDAGTLEHIFDIPTALANIVKMTKVGGEVILMLPSSNAIDHGFYSISPTLLYDYFGSNGFDNFSCYLREGSSFNLTKKGKVYRYNHVGNQFTLTSKNVIDVIFFATKVKTIKDIVKPMQSLYVSEFWSNRQNTNKTPKRNKRKLFKGLRSIITPFLKKHRPELYDVLRLSRKRKRNLTFIGKF